MGNDFMNQILAQTCGNSSRKLLTFVHFKFASHIVVDEVWKLGATFNTSKSTTLPHTSGDQLECFLCQYLDDPKKKYVQSHIRRVEISCPAAATPITMDCPHPLWQASRAALMTETTPVQSNV